MERDAFLQRLRPDITRHVGLLGGSREAHQWLMSEDEVGLAVADVTDTDRAIHELLASLVETGAWPYRLNVNRASWPSCGATRG